MLIGSRLKELRLSFGVTQEELGKILGVTKASICCYEKGSRTPTIENLIDLINYFGISADYLLGCEKQVTTNSKKPKTYLMSEEEVKFIELLRKTKNYESIIKDPLNIISRINNI